MSIAIMLATQVRNRREKLYREIFSFLQANPKHEVLYLVPDHLKFETEHRLLAYEEKIQATDSGYAGLMQAQVFSFQRLLWYLEAEKLWPKRRVLNDTLNFMLLNKAVLAIQDDLEIFRGKHKHAGFVEQLLALFTEFEEGNLTPAVIEEILAAYAKEGEAVNTYTLKKLAELSKIYAKRQEVQAEVGDKVVDQEARLQKLLGERDLSHTMFVLDGFEYFTHEQLSTLSLILNKASHVHFVLQLDEPHRTSSNLWQDVFYFGRKTYQQLLNIFPEEPKITYAQEDRAYEPLFMQLEKQWVSQNFRQPHFDHQETSRQGTPIQLWACESEYLEAEQIANEIYALVSQADGAYRYRDFQILTRDIERYRSYLLPALQQNNIPYFLDFEETMDEHPLSRLLNALYQIYRYRWRYQDIYDLLRTELCVPDAYQEAGASPDKNMKKFRRILDETENIILEQGYEGPKWWAADVQWLFLPVDDEGHLQHSQKIQARQTEANILKELLVNLLEPLFTRWEAGLKTADALEDLYETLLQMNVPKQLLAWRDQNIEAGDIEAARRHEQAWQTFIQLLDDYYDLFGEEEFSAEDFFALLKRTFQEAHFSLIPATLDAVKITSLEKTQGQHARVSFALGLTKEILPKTYQQTSILGQEEREQLAPFFDRQQGFGLSDTEQNIREQALMYQLLLSGTERLYLSYPYNAFGEKEVEPAPVLKILKTHYPCTEATIKSRDNIFKLRTGNWQGQLLYAMRALRGVTASPRLDAFWQQHLKTLANSEVAGELTKKVEGSLTYQNKIEPLSKKLAQELYRSPLEISVSQLETYNTNPFMYFLLYGLRLREREIFELSPIRTGNYYHAAMDQILKHWQPDRKLKDLLKDAWQKLNDEKRYPEFKIFSAHPKYRFMKRQMQADIDQLAAFAYQQLEAMKTPSQIFTEQRFGFPEDHLTYPLTLKDGQKIYLRGIIDRIDLWSKEELFQVIDYKSSPQNYSLANLLAGRNLQLLTYLNVVKKALAQKYPHLEAVGAFHQIIKPSLTPLEKEQQWTNNQQADEHFREFLLKGYFNELNEDLLLGLDPSAQAGERSSYYYYQKTKSGSISKSVGRNQQFADYFSLLLNFVERKIQETAEEILAGEIPLLPFEDNVYDLSKQYPWRGISLFDVLAGGNHYRESAKGLKTIEDFIQRLASKGE